jgi:hypothetical protein
MEKSCSFKLEGDIERTEAAASGKSPDTAIVERSMARVSVSR